MSEETPNDLHNRKSGKKDDKENTATIHSYYDEKFNRLSNSTKSVLKIIEMECETISDLLKTYEDTKPHNKSS